MDKRTKQILVLFSVVALAIYLYQCQNQCDCISRVNYDTVNVLEDIDLDQLFSKPNSSKLEEIAEEWSSFDVSSTLIKKLKTVDYFSGKQVDVFSHVTENGKHYGAIVCPKTYDVNTELPVLLWAHGLNQNDPIIDLDGSRFFKALIETFPNYLIIIPAYRGQAIAIGGNRYCADGFFGDAYDGATDDALRLLDIAKNNYPVDLTRIVTYGISRGGTVAMLSGIRDTSISCVVTQSGPMKFHDRLAYEMYNFQFRYQFLSTVKPMSLLRRKMIQSSPVYFAQHYSKPVLILQGKQDPIVPVSNAIKLAEALGDNATLILRNDDHFLDELDFIKEWLEDNNSL